MAGVAVLHLSICRIGGIERESKSKSISAVVNGFQVTFSFSDEPNIGLERKVKGILLDSFIAQNKEGIPQSGSDEFEGEDRLHHLRQLAEKYTTYRRHLGVISPNYFNINVPKY